MRLGPWELLAILAIVLIVFGAGKLPDVAKSIGKGIREFRKSASGEDEKADSSPQLKTSEKDQDKKQS